MEKIKIPINRVTDIVDAITMVSKLDTLKSETSYWLSNLYNKLKPRYKSFIHARESKRLELSNKQAQIIKQAAPNWQAEVKAIDAEFTQFVEQLKAKIAESEKGSKDIDYEVRLFKRTDFEAQEDLKRTQIVNGKAIETPIKKGECLVPIEFFMLMDDLITD